MLVQSEKRCQSCPSHELDADMPIVCLSTHLTLLNIIEPVLGARPEVTGPGHAALWGSKHTEWVWPGLSLVMPMKLFEFEFEFEADTEAEREREGETER